jgi:hypothetical protein
MVDTSNIRPGAIVAGFGFLGLILAVLLQYLYQNSIVVTAYIDGTAITLPGVQVCVIIISLLVGVVVALLTSR